MHLPSLQLIDGSGALHQACGAQPCETSAAERDEAEIVSNDRIRPLILKNRSRRAVSESDCIRYPCHSRRECIRDYSEIHSKWTRPRTCSKSPLYRSCRCLPGTVGELTVALLPTGGLCGTQTKPGDLERRHVLEVADSSMSLLNNRQLFELEIAVHLIALHFGTPLSNEQYSCCLSQHA